MNAAPEHPTFFEMAGAMYMYLEIPEEDMPRVKHAAAVLGLTIQGLIEYAIHSQFRRLQAMDPEERAATLREILEADR